MFEIKLQEWWWALAFPSFRCLLRFGRFSGVRLIISHMLYILQMVMMREHFRASLSLAIELRHYQAIRVPIGGEWDEVKKTLYSYTNWLSLNLHTWHHRWIFCIFWLSSSVCSLFLCVILSFFWTNRMVFL